MKKSARQDPLAERPDLDFTKGTCGGKYTNQLPQGTNLAIIDPELHKHFPDSESVNKALRAFLDIRKHLEPAAPPRRTSKRQSQAA